MTWTMPAETAPQDRIWMSFPRAWPDESPAEREAAYKAWTTVAHAIAEFEPVTMIVDPSETTRAANMLGRRNRTGQPRHRRLLDARYRADLCPCRRWVRRGRGLDLQRLGRQHRDGCKERPGAGGFRGQVAGVPVLPSLLVNEGGGIHVDGEGTILLTETVQLGQGRNPHADAARVEAEMARLLGAEKAIWLKRGLTRDYDSHGTLGHVDIVACFPAPGKVLMHDQRDPRIPTMPSPPRSARSCPRRPTARGRKLEIIPVPAPKTLKDAEGFVDYSYINHLAVNGGIIACGFGEDPRRRPGA
jgi:agmatine deiminase